ncbi:hypothetical protein [Oryzobacter terrae]|uniref:hypothetical protein n=1 Tax=Oryzobacter terrae TaxID=1620385 RepID=UPI0036705F04
MTPSRAFLQALSDERTIEALHLRLARTAEDATEALDRLADLAEIEAAALSVPHADAPD